MQKIHRIVLLTMLMASTISNGYPQIRRKLGKSARKIETTQQLMVFPGDIVTNQSQTKEVIIEFPNEEFWDISADSDLIRLGKKGQRSHKMESTGAIMKFPGHGEPKMREKEASAYGIWNISPEFDRLKPRKVQTNRNNARISDLSLASGDDSDGGNLDDTFEEQTTLTSLNEMSKPNTLEECIKSGHQFCEDSSVKYTNEFIESILKKPENQMFMKFFRDPNEVDDAPTRNRFGARPQGIVVPLCDTMKSVTFPTYGRGYDGDYRAIINNANYRQPVHIEKCTSSEPNPIWKPKNHRLVCSQGYQTYQLLGPADPDLNTFNLKTFEVPSHCKIDLIKVH